MYIQIILFKPTTKQKLGLKILLVLFKKSAVLFRASK